MAVLESFEITSYQPSSFDAAVSAINAQPPCQCLSGEYSRRSDARRAEEIAARTYDIPQFPTHRVSVDTLFDWAPRYRRGGFAALAPQPRRDRGQSRALTPQLAELIERLKRENSHRTGTTLLRELALVSTIGTVSPSYLHRFLKQRGLTTRQLLTRAAHKKFEAEFSNQLWQSDMLFGPYVQCPSGGRMQAFLYALLDDASRLVPYAEFYAQQGPDAFLDCLRRGLATRGIPVYLYVDNGKVFRSQQLARRCITRHTYRPDTTVSARGAREN